MRYSRKSDSEGEQPKERLSIPLLNRTRFKTYTHADAEKVISSILLNKLNFNDGSSGEIRNRGELAEKLYLALNTAEKGKRAGVALDIAEYIIQHTAMKGVYDDAENAEFVETVSLLKQYLHSFNLSSIYEELKHRYGKRVRVVICVQLHLVQFVQKSKNRGVLPRFLLFGGDNWDRTSDLMHVKHAL